MPDTHLRTALDTHPIGTLLRTGTLTHPDVTLDFADVTPIHHAFAPMVRTQTYDLSELAVVTALQAIAHGHPLTLLPVVVAARFQRKCLITHRDHPLTHPTQLRGLRIGVRSYTQTTGMWIRSHLTEDYGITAEESHWITQDEAHVPEHHDPPYVHRTLTGSLTDALRNGTIDAAVLGNDLPEGDEFRPVFDHPTERDHTWYTTHGYAPVNHLVAVANTTLHHHPDAVRAAYTLLTRAEHDTTAHQPPHTPHLTRSGIDHLTTPLNEIADACHAQGLLPRRLTADELLTPAHQLLDTTPATS
ncbi:hypothetical protein RVR_8604 [Actinacidiphila reveromycinica]|uniref:4,5-dihydroxyphthalate decarboxylase n=1 Tax=Actinacidiphila reveromycinica TaxID=659352 RepID=A0A7U3UYN5_9ACTN|nr:hypothetical protein [Streptomyces sp. SN-593]BBB01283.1 hypothetical protein RVR_8604 [Streptomyces sp. SN-593]